MKNPSEKYVCFKKGQISLAVWLVRRDAELKIKLGDTNKFLQRLAQLTMKGWLSNLDLRGDTGLSTKYGLSFDNLAHLQSVWCFCRPSIWGMATWTSMLAWDIETGGKTTTGSLEPTKFDIEVENSCNHCPASSQHSRLGDAENTPLIEYLKIPSNFGRYPTKFRIIAISKA